MRILFRLTAHDAPLAWEITHRDGRLEARSAAGQLLLESDATYRINYEEGVALLTDGRLTGTSMAECERVGGSYLRVALHETGIEVRNDRLGTIPVYHTSAGDRLVLGSILADVAHGTAAAPDELAALELMLLEHPIGQRTLVAGVSLLPPAVVLNWTVTSGMRWQRYWQAEPAQAQRASDPSDQTARLIALLGDARARCVPQDAHTAFPVTGGLDSRINLALDGVMQGRDLLYTVLSPGDPEVRIARRLARRMNRKLHEIPFDSNAWWSFLEVDRRDGEMYRGQCWLGSTGRCLRSLDRNATILDGYLQDAWFNPRLVTSTEEQGLHRASLRFALYRWRNLTGASGHPLLEDIRQDIEEHYRSLGAPGLEANQRFYLENRSRRFVLDTVRITQRHLPVAMPGLDHQLMDFALSLPWNQRSGGPLYRDAIIRLRPDLAGVPYDKTGLPLTSRRRRALSRTIAGYAMWILNRQCPDRRFLRGPEPHLQAALRIDPNFRAAVIERLNGSRWVQDTLRMQQPGERIALASIRNQAVVPIALGALTIAQFEHQCSGMRPPSTTAHANTGC